MFSPLKRDRKNCVCTLDIETGRRGQLLEGAVYDGQEVYFFTSWADWLSWVEAHISDERYQKYVAHNGGAFDWVHLAEYLFTTKIPWRIVMSGSRIVFCELELRGVKIVLQDSIQVLLKGLGDLTNVFKVAMPKEKIDVANIETVFKKDRMRFRKYLTADVIGLYQVISAFQAALEIDFFPFTISQLSMYIFRRRFLEREFKTLQNKYVDDFISRAYAGGRVECFRPGKHAEVYTYDINSLYPFVMQKYLMPVGLPVKTFSFRKGLGFYEVKFFQRNKTIPPLLWQKGCNGLEFCYEGEGVFFSEELRRAEELGIKFTVRQGFVFPESAMLFNSFVDHFYNMRRKNKGTALDYIAKILMNSLYGKTGQREETTELEAIHESDELNERIRAGEKITPYNLAKNIFSVQKSRKIAYRMVYIAAAVTAYARLELYSYILAYKDSLIYCDTDSIHLTTPIDNIGLELGQLKKEESGSGIYLGRKQYQIGDKIKFKGIKTKDKLTGNIFSLANYEELFKSGETNYAFGIFPAIKSVIRGDKAACIKSIRKKLTPSRHNSNFKIDKK